MNVSCYDSEEASKLKHLTQLVNVEPKFCSSSIQKAYPGKYSSAVLLARFLSATHQA